MIHNFTSSLNTHDDDDDDDDDDGGDDDDDNSYHQESPHLVWACWLSSMSPAALSMAPERFVSIFAS